MICYNRYNKLKKVRSLVSNKNHVYFNQDMFQICKCGYLQ